jgi:hypothetical protein
MGARSGGRDGLVVSQGATIEGAAAAGRVARARLGGGVHAMPPGRPVMPAHTLVSAPTETTAPVAPGSTACDHGGPA